MNRLNTLLFKARYAAIAITALYVGLFVFGFWIATPDSYFVHRWEDDWQMIVGYLPAELEPINVAPDDEGVVQAPPEEAPAIGFPLRPGDVVVAIDGRPVYRGAPIYAFPLPEIYQFTVERAGERIELTVPYPGRLTTTGFYFRFPGTVLVLVYLLVGALILHLALRDDQLAIYTGYIMLLHGVATASVYGEVFFVPGSILFRWAWIASAVGWAYLAFIPSRETARSGRTRFFAGLWVVAIVLGLVGFFEALVLFPRQTSLAAEIGISFYDLALLANALGLLALVTIIIVRSVRLPKSYEKQQARVLLLFLSLVAVPVILLTLIPRLLADFVFLPVPIAAVLFTLIPVGYCYVIYRKRYLSLDLFFSRGATILTISVIVLLVYGTGIMLINNFYIYDNAFKVTLSILLVLPVMVIGNQTSSRVRRLVNRTFYGDRFALNASLPDFSAQIAAQPEVTTLRAIVHSLCHDFESPEAALFLKDESGQFSRIAEAGVDELPARLGQSPSFSQPLVRAAAGEDEEHPLFAAYSWAELLVPIIVRDEQIGVLILSPPNMSEYFNAQDVAYIARVADIIGVGWEAMHLFDASRALSLELLSAQEMERQMLATRIHDQPLQTINFVAQNLRSLARSDGLNGASGRVEQQVELLGEVMTELRNICAGLHPPVLEQGVSLVVREVATRFETKYGLRVGSDVRLPAGADLYDVELASAVYRILIESLNNVLKHAEVDEAEVLLQVTPEQNELRLVIADQGVGSALPNLSISELIRQQHLGIFGMHEWARTVGGKLAIVANEPRGTRVIFTAPLRESEADYV